MFTNKTGCTIYEKTVRERAPAYIRHVTGPVFWQPSEGETTGNDRRPKRSVFVNIPEKSADYLPKTDDRVVDSVIDDDSPPDTALTVTNVKDLRYGSPKVRHIELTLE